MSAFRERAENVAEFERIAARMAATLRAGDVIALEGELGAGKTAFVRALVAALHGSDVVSSPTFVFRHRYDGDPPVDHLDFYRLEEPGEARELGLEEPFDPAAVTVVEWPSRLPRQIPSTAVRIAIRGAGDGPRELDIERP